MKTTPSSAVKRRRCSAITSSLRWPLAKATTGSRWRAAKPSSSATNPRLIGAISAEDAKGCPRCSRKKLTAAKVVYVNIQIHPVDRLDRQPHMIAEDRRDILCYHLRGSGRAVLPVKWHLVPTCINQRI